MELNLRYGDFEISPYFETHTEFENDTISFLCDKIEIAHEKL